MPMGVRRDGRWLDVTVSRPKDKDILMIPVWLTWLDERKEQRELLCQVVQMRFGWTVVVAGDELLGKRLVDGFHSRWKAIQYAIEIRPDLNDHTADS